MAASAAEVGVPEIKPVAVLKLKPLPMVGDIEYEAIAPPVDVMA